MLVLYYLFIDYGIFGSYGQHLMIALLKENMIFIYNNHQITSSTIILLFLLTSNSSATTIYSEVFIQHPMSDSPETINIYIYN